MKQIVIGALKPALCVSFVLFLLCGLLYPLALTGIGQLAFKHQAEGSILSVNGKEVGSEIVGQQFTDARFFKGRVSAVNYNTYGKEDLVPDAQTGEPAYGGVASGSQNYSNTNPELQARVEESILAFLESNPGVKREDIPADLMTASGSGLDPHISPEAAEIQIPAIARATGLSDSELKKIVANNTEKKVFGIFGQDRVNVLKMNVEIAQTLKLL